MAYKNFGELVAALRKENGLTQKQLAKRLEINRATLAKIENSQRAVSLDEATQFASVFGISLDTMLSSISESENNGNTSFVMAFRSKGILDEEDMKEIKSIELLVDALALQEQIYRSEN